jgi:hypothetical protein
LNFASFARDHLFGRNVDAVSSLAAQLRRRKGPNPRGFTMRVNIKMAPEGIKSSLKGNPQSIRKVGVPKWVSCQRTTGDLASALGADQIELLSAPSGLSRDGLLQGIAKERRSLK